MSEAVSAPALANRSSGWRAVRNKEGVIVHIEKVFAFGNFRGTMVFVQAVADVAEQQNHHPALLVQYGSCAVRWSTHDTQCVTEKDIECAALTDAILEAPCA